MAQKFCDNLKEESLSQTYRKVLWIIIAINAAMFVVEYTAGIYSSSKALEADSLDFLGDTFTYAITLFVLGRSLRLRASAALIKGVILGLLGLWIFASTIYRVFTESAPTAEIMGGVGLLALAANMVSVLLLLKHREGDSNIRSVWLCSRNDAIGNIAVILAGIGVFLTKNFWPDLIVAAVLASLFLHSAFLIARQALVELGQNKAM